MKTSVFYLKKTNPSDDSLLNLGYGKQLQYADLGELNDVFMSSKIVESENFCVVNNNILLTKDNYKIPPYLERDNDFAAKFELVKSKFQLVDIVPTADELFRDDPGDLSPFRLVLFKRMTELLKVYWPDYDKNWIVVQLYFPKIRDLVTRKCRELKEMALVNFVWTKYSKRVKINASMRFDGIVEYKLLMSKRGNLASLSKEETYPLL